MPPLSSHSHRWLRRSSTHSFISSLAISSYPSTLPPHQNPLFALGSSVLGISSNIRCAQELSSTALGSSSEVPLTRSTVMPITFFFFSSSLPLLSLSFGGSTPG